MLGIMANGFMPGLGAGSDELNALRTLLTRKNPAVQWIVFGAIGFLLLIVNLPWLREAFNLGAIGLAEWVISVAAALLAFTGFEVYKNLARRRQ
jgi:magnesium-transporting ATPase (P-type)